VKRTLVGVGSDHVPTRAGMSFGICGWPDGASGAEKRTVTAASPGTVLTRGATTRTRNRGGFAPGGAGWAELDADEEPALPAAEEAARKPTTMNPESRKTRRARMRFERQSCMLTSYRHGECSDSIGQSPRSMAATTRRARQSAGPSGTSGSPTR
jgi:hypothetical protein